MSLVELDLNGGPSAVYSTWKTRRTTTVYCGLHAGRLKNGDNTLDVRIQHAPGQVANKRIVITKLGLRLGQ